MTNELTDEELLALIDSSLPQEGPRVLTQRQRENDAMCQPGMIVRCLVGFPTDNGMYLGDVSDVRITSRDEDGRTAYGVVEGPEYAGFKVQIDVFEFSVRPLEAAE